MTTVAEPTVCNWLCLYLELTVSIFRTHNLNSPSSSIISTVAVPAVLLISTSLFPIRVTVKLSVPSAPLSARIVMSVQDLTSPLRNDPIV